MPQVRILPKAPAANAVMDYTNQRVAGSSPALRSFKKIGGSSVVEQPTSKQSIANFVAAFHGPLAQLV